MPRFIKGLLFGLVAVFLLGVAALWWAGPDWRALIANAPSGRDVLSWDIGQRDAAFRMMDRIPVLSDVNEMQPSDAPKPLEKGAPLSLSVDVDAYMAQGRYASLVILHNGKIRLEKYAMGFDAGGRWTSFSVGKSFTSTLVGAAIKDGYIASTDDKVSDYIAGLSGSPYDDVTIEQLLTMTSGVEWNEDYEDPQSDVAQFDFHAAPEGLAQIVSYMRTKSQAHAPGEVWNYSTGETNLIGILVSEATGKTLADYLTEKIWQPYGMADKATWLKGRDGNELSGCCIQATTRDFARYGQFMLDGAVAGGEAVLPEGWIAAATKDHARTGRMAPGYGYQWWVYDDGSYTAGGIFGQGIYVDPSRGLVIASNGNWRSALGLRDGERQGREDFYRAVREAIDAQAR